MPDYEINKAIKLTHLFKERVTFPQEIAQEAKNLLTTPAAYDETIVNSKWNVDAKNGIIALKHVLPNIENFVADEIKHALSSELEKAGIKMGKMMQMLRIAIMGTGAGPDLMLSMEIMGKDEVNLRLEKALAELPNIS